MRWRLASQESRGIKQSILFHALEHLCEIFSCRFRASRSAISWATLDGSQSVVCLLTRMIGKINGVHHLRRADSSLDTLTEDDGLVPHVNFIAHALQRKDSSLPSHISKCDV